MKKEWGFIEKILRGQKIIESRWYATKRAPWDAIREGDTVYFKNSGELVVIEAQVKKVLQFSDLDPKKVENILQEYGTQIGIAPKDTAKFFKKFRAKQYAILVFLKNPKKITPFQINKKGFGAMASWITVKNVSLIRIDK